MSVRSFTVFQDTPTEIQKISLASDKNLVTTTAADVAATLLSTLAAIEKENLHPLTGERAAQTTTNASKKRKTAVLVTKVVVPPSSSKKHKELKSEPKKLRKSASGNGNRSDGRKKIPRGSRPARKASPLPRVDEEQELSTATPNQRVPTRLIVSQAKIDSKCYELTVSPLADVSEAYDTATETSDQESVFDKVGASLLCSPVLIDPGFRNNLLNLNFGTTSHPQYRTPRYHLSKRKLLLLLQGLLPIPNSLLQSADKFTRHLPFHLRRLPRNVLKKLGHLPTSKPTPPIQNNDICHIPRREPFELY